jgi:hypothetical protein
MAIGAAEIDLGTLGFDRGGHLLVRRALADLPAGASLAVSGADPNLEVHLGAWVRAEGHRLADGLVVKGRAGTDRWRGATRAGRADPGHVEPRAPASWGLAARGALVEEGGPELHVADLDTRPAVWSEIAPRLYARACAAQWDPEQAVDWTVRVDLPVEVEAAVVQVMTYLVENEQAALMVPARFVGRVHPHYREVAQFLAVQMADEARHIEVFGRRARLAGGPMGVSAAAGRASLQTLLDERDFSLASFLLSVLGEGTFLSLLSFLQRYAPDPVTREICRLAQQDEARHVAFGLAHLEEQVAAEPSLRARLASAVERRHRALERSAGLSPDVHDALIVLAAGEWTPEAIGRGADRVRQLQGEMDAGRRHRLVRLGFTDAEAADLAALHTRNFM